MVANDNETLESIIIQNAIIKNGNLYVPVDLKAIRALVQKKNVSPHFDEQISNPYFR